MAQPTQGWHNNSDHSIPNREMSQPPQIPAAAAAGAAAGGGSGGGASAVEGAGAFFAGTQPDQHHINIEEHPVILTAISSYLGLAELGVMGGVSKTVRDAVAESGPLALSLGPKTVLSSDPNSQSLKVLSKWGRGLQSLSLHRCHLVDKQALPSLLRVCPGLRKLTVHDVELANWSDESISDAMAGLSKLEELRLHASDLTQYQESPFAAIVHMLASGRLTTLRKLTLFTRLDAAGTAALAAYLSDPNCSRRLMKLKISTALISSPGGLEVLLALGRTVALQKLTIMRPEGMGEPLRKSQCAIIAQLMVSCKQLYSVHLRRAGLWTDSLSALCPASVCPNIRNLKLDSNSLAYLSSSYFSDSMDMLLSRLPSLTALHLGNNQLDSGQAVALAASLTRHRINKLENLTLGSNDIGDAGLAAVLKALPNGMKQLYLHGCDIHDDGLGSLRDAMMRMDSLWGLGLNGNPIGDAGIRTLCRAIRGQSQLRDVGITLSDATDEGIKRLAHALHTCPNLRFVYLYTQGFKAAVKVTDEGKARLKALLPAYATPAFDHRLSRYLKSP